MANKPERVGAKEIESQGTLSTLGSEARYGKCLAGAGKSYDLNGCQNIHFNLHLEEMAQILQGELGKYCTGLCDRFDYSFSGRMNLTLEEIFPAA